MSTGSFNGRPWALKDPGITALETGQDRNSVLLLCPKAGQMFIYYARSSNCIYFVISLTQ